MNECVRAMLMPIDGYIHGAYGALVIGVNLSSSKKFIFVADPPRKTLDSRLFFASKDC
jgi:hypothetical protein